MVLGAAARFERLRRSSRLCIGSRAAELLGVFFQREDSIDESCVIGHSSGVDNEMLFRGVIR